MNRIKQWFTDLIYGTHNSRINDLIAINHRLKIDKQKQIDKVNKYWKTREYNAQKRSLKG